jgi:YD repeat-containing protein
VVLERDPRGHIVKEQRTAGGDTRIVESRFDYSGLRIERETSFGHRTRYGWNGAGALVENPHAGKTLIAVLEDHGQSARARATEERLDLLATERAEGTAP